MRFHSQPKITPKTPPGSDQWTRPWVWMKYFSYHPAVFARLLGAKSLGIEPGDLVKVYDKNGQPFAVGFSNQEARVPLRLIDFGDFDPDEAIIEDKIRAAVRLRKDWLRLPEVTEAWRAVHSDADQLPGLVADVYRDVLSLRISTWAIWRRLPELIPLLHETCGTTRVIARFEGEAARAERVGQPEVLNDAPRSIRFSEHGVRFEVDFTEGHKTGFFCDQRDNRKMLSGLARGADVLDLCCYTGGFSIAAKMGGAESVTGIDLDERAIEQAKRNANLNQLRINFTHADAFTYSRQMRDNGREYDIVVCDPPKFIFGKEENDVEEGRRKYADLNGLALSMVKREGLLVTCSCSGHLGEADFLEILIKAAQFRGRRLQIIGTPGAGGDHPMLSTCPETRYLKTIWARVI